VSGKGGRSGREDGRFLLKGENILGKASIISLKLAISYNKCKHL
jgi:hypothetical protein